VEVKSLPCRIERLERVAGDVMPSSCACGGEEFNTDPASTST